MAFRWRFWFIILILSLACAGLVWRMVDLMVLNRPFLLNQGNARSLRIVKIPAYRGIITDRNGEPLAISVPVDAIWLQPKLFSPSVSELNQLSVLLKIPVPTIQKIANANRKRDFAYLIRGIDPAIAQSVKTLHISGVALRSEFRRYYPEAEVTAQLLGFTNVDDRGQAGIELEYNQWLRGISGRKRVLKDRLGRTVANIDLLRAPQPGHNLALSIDRRIQFLAYSVLKNAVQKHNARSGSVVVLNVKTGEVLAMANVPSFNPNSRHKIESGRFRNRALTDVFEPGSTIKAFSVTNALSSGKYTPTTPIDTRPGWMKVNRRTVRDDANYGLLDVTGVLQKSSNVGVTKMTLTLPPNSLYKVLHSVGFGRRTELGFPGESPGVLVKRTVWDPFVLATLSFGYGMSVTNAQLAQAYALLADHGIKRPITLIRINPKRSTQVPGKQVIDPKVADEIVMMLESVVKKGGTATRAQIPGYRISGKTGTVRMVGPHGYEKHHHTAIFVGLAPVNNPQLVVSVVVKDPEKNGFYGGLVSAPVFSKVMGGALRILDIPPDE